MATPPEPLIESLTRRRCMLLVGSGLSATAGYPTWDALIGQLVEEANGAYPDQAEDLRSFAATTPSKLVAAEVLRGRPGKQRYGQVLRNIFARPATPQPSHRVIAQTDYRAIITTNFDKLIETVITFERGWTPPIFTPDSMPSLGSALFEDIFFVMKLHGDISTPESIILTSQDYDRLMLRSPSLQAFLQAVILNFTVLFVGYSLSDPDFELVLKELNLIFQGTTPPHYALLPDPHALAVEHMMRGLNIQVIPYDSKDGHREAAEFLAELQKLSPFVAEAPVPA